MTFLMSKGCVTVCLLLFSLLAIPVSISLPICLILLKKKSPLCLANFFCLLVYLFYFSMLSTCAVLLFDNKDLLYTPGRLRTHCVIRLALNSQRSAFLSLSSAVIESMGHHGWLCLFYEFILFFYFSSYILSPSFPTPALCSLGAQDRNQHQESLIALLLIF